MKYIQNIALANHCPLIGGPAVIKARTLLAGMGYKAWDFTDNCPPTSVNGSENGARIGMSVEEKESTRLSMYPNPAKDRFSVAQVGEAKLLSIRVINAQGQEVYKNTTLANLTEIPTSTWAAGIYVVRLNIEQQAERAYKLVINR